MHARASLRVTERRSVRKISEYRESFYGPWIHGKYRSTVYNGLILQQHGTLARCSPGQVAVFLARNNGGLRDRNPLRPNSVSDLRFQQPPARHLDAVYVKSAVV
jgi:hypothetical protein